VAKLFAELFAGSEYSHGVQTIREGGNVDHHTADGPATPEDYRAHLAGVRGLGLVPILKDGTCRFAAIDIDVDTINHGQLLTKVIQHKMPLTVCRSKSGGAHLYLFSEQGFKPSKIIPVLKRWAGILGYPKSEVFPKQIQVNKSGQGNWINLPYFNGDNTNRYAIGPEGAMTLEEFLNSVVYWDGNDQVVSEQELVIIGQAPKITPASGPVMPPCLQYLAEHGLPEGKRNDGMFNFGVFLRKAHPKVWEEKFLEFNEKFCQPPLPREEMVRLLKSVGGTKYQYRCEQEPILSHCDRPVCHTLPFGYTHMPWKESGSLGDFLISHLRKIDTDPPQFMVEINGGEMTLTNEEFYNFDRLMQRVEDIMNICIPPMKSDRWRAMRHELHLKQEVIAAPDDASEEGSIMNSVMDFLTRFKNSQRGEEAILMGTPVELEKYICFKAVDLQNFLKHHRRQFIDSNVLYTMLYKQGAQFKETKIKGRTVKVWMYPIDKLDIQTEDYTAPEFNAIREEM